MKKNSTCTAAILALLVQNIVFVILWARTLFQLDVKLPLKMGAFQINCGDYTCANCLRSSVAEFLQNFQTSLDYTFQYLMVFLIPQML